MNFEINEALETKCAPIIIQSEGSSFNAGIVLNETNYDIWSQIMEMHIAEKEKLSLIRRKLPALIEKYDGVTRRSNQNWSSQKRQDQTKTNYPKPTDDADKSTYKYTQSLLVIPKIVLLKLLGIKTGCNNAIY
ncbi:hypothetical protein Lal_00012805 [Lupinus albus]|nr:hypothetical protein Lal_00012805 [Lupinus albus]